MGLINIATDNPEGLFKKPEYKVLPGGTHLFVVANALAVTQAANGSGNNIIKCEFRCQDEDENKGLVVFHNFVFITNPITDGQKLSLEINNAQLAQFAAACEVATVADLMAGADFDLDDFEGKFFNAKSTVKSEETQELDEAGNKIKAPKASIKQFLFEPAKTE